MTIYSTPRLTRSQTTKLDELDRLREALGRGVSSPAQWVTRLRREVQATAYASSIEIEGFTTTAKEASAVVAGNAPTTLGGEGAVALACYLRAMQHVGAMVDDPAFEWHPRVVLDLHFDACSFQQDKHPGSLRQKGIQVTDGTQGKVAFTGPDWEDVQSLLGETIDWLAASQNDEHVVVRAAMAHLHVVSIHPFEDGNGRIARIVQSLVLALEGGLTPELGSIEKYLADNTPAYYKILKATQRGSYAPELDATGWVEFCIDAHIRQARGRIEQTEAASRRWDALEQLVAHRNWPERLVIAMEQALTIGTDRATYAAEADIADPTASGDFRRLVDAGYLDLNGRGPSTRYVPAPPLRRIAESANPSATS